MKLKSNTSKNSMAVGCVIKNAIISISIASLPAAAFADSLWVIYGSYQIHNITKLGASLSSFSMAPIISGIDVDRSDGTLWVSSEHTATIYNVNYDGQVISSFGASAFDQNASTLEGVAVDNNDFSLWIVDDSTYKIYNVKRNGVLISSFSTQGAGSTGGQDIAIDIKRNTLWVIDNEDLALYEFYKTGSLRSTVSLGSLNPAIQHPQSVSFDEKNNTIWIVGYSPNYIYHIDRYGNQLHAYPASQAPQGIAYDDFD